MRYSNPDPKNVASRNPMVIRRKKVAKELTEICHQCGIGTLFPPSTTLSEKGRIKFETKMHRVVNQALELGMNVPQELIDLVNSPPEPNPSTKPFIENDPAIPF